MTTMIHIILKAARTMTAMALPAISAVLAASLSACSDWTTPQSVGVQTVHPWEQDPQLWEDYRAAVRDYKSRSHSLIYVRFENSPEGALNEKAYMRCLPDSLDFVSLTNAENFSSFDAEDMEWMKAMGTKVLYQLDFASDPDMLYDAALRDAALAHALETFSANGLDGFAVTGLPKDDGGVTDAAAAAVFDTLIQAAGTDAIIAFEGDPAFVPADRLSDIDLFVLPTQTAENAYDLRNIVLDAQDLGVTKDRMILAASFDGSFYDSENVSADPLTSVADQVIALGPMAGLALFDIESDYYNADGDWLTLRRMISRMNP